MALEVLLSISATNKKTNEDCWERLNFRKGGRTYEEPAPFETNSDFGVKVEYNLFLI